MRSQRPCLGVPGRPCATLTRNPGGRCRPCEAEHQRRRNQRRVQYRGAWQTFSRAARASEPWCHCDLGGHGHDGQICGEVDDLTLDHEHAAVMCRSCNSANRRNVGEARAPDLLH